MATNRPRQKKSSPILGMAAGMIDEASANFITKDSKFKHTFEVHVDQLIPDPGQARKKFDNDALAELAATMAEHGQLQPVLVRRNPMGTPKWIIVAGERRWRAANFLNWPTVLAIEFTGDAEVASLIENLQRVDLSPYEEAAGLQHLLEVRGWSQSQAVETLGKPKSEISATLRLLSLGKECLAKLSEHGVSKNVLVELARIEDVDLRNDLISQAQDGKLTVKQVRVAKDRPQKSLIDTFKKSAPSTPLSFKTLDKITSRIAVLRTQRQTISPSERDKLVSLRREIDETLAKIKVE